MTCGLEDDSVWHLDQRRDIRWPFLFGFYASLQKSPFECFDYHIEPLWQAKKQGIDMHSKFLRFSNLLVQPLQR